MTANEFIGPPAAGLLVAAGAVAAFATPVGLWMVAVGALLLVRGSFKVPSAGSGMRAEIAEGLRFVWRNRVLRTFAIMVGVSNFATNAMMAVFVLYAVGRHSEMGLSRVEYGVLLAVIPAGSLLGSVVAERVEASFGRARSLAVSSVSVAVLVGIAAVTANVFVVGAAFFAGGVGIIIMNVIMVSLRQRMTPDRLLGRVNSCYRLVAWGTMPLGTVAAGVLGSTIGLRWLFAIMGLLGLTTASGLLVANDAAMDASESAAPADGLATAEA
jgi:MFS family permease